MRRISKWLNAEAAPIYRAYANDAVLAPSFVRQAEDFYQMRLELADALNKLIHTVNDPRDPNYGNYDERWDSRDMSYGTLLLPDVLVQAPLTWKAHNKLSGSIKRRCKKCN